MNSNLLARIFDWIGDALEKFNPSAYKFLAAALPYMTPIPVAWLTAKSASDYLGLPANVAFVLVFALEGIGLWFTSMLVDAVVDWIRSRNIKTFALVVLFGIVIVAYVTILVTLNVTLESSTQAATKPGLSRVITLLCFLPLLTGIGNGYYKIKLDIRTSTNEQTQYERSLAERIRSENRSDRMERYRLRTANGGERTNGSTNVRSKRTNTANERSSRTNNGELRTFVLQILDEYERTNHSAMGVSEVAKVIAMNANKQNGKGNSFDGYEKYKGYVSEVRKSWLAEHPQYMRT